jgi:drug/metabolite transporter (DMT)-like permease
MSRRGWVLFGAMCVIWGVPYLLIKVAVDELAPATLVLARTALGTLLLLPFVLTGGHLRGLRAAWKPLVIYTLVEICAPWLLLGFAETRLSSSLTGLLLAAVPLVGAVLARWTGARERLGTRRLTGLLVGIGGVAALVGLDLGSVDALAMGAIALVAVGYAVGPVILTRSLAHLPGLGVVVASLALSTVLYLPVGIAQAPAHWPSAKVMLSVLGLAAVCTALAFVVFFKLIAEVGPARATVITYVNPAVAVGLGVLILKEPFTAAIGVGFVLVLAGSVLATSGARPQAAAQPLTIEPAVAPADEPAGAA